MVCSVPGNLSGHSEESKKNGERCCTLIQSKFILETTGSGKHNLSSFVIREGVTDCL